MGFDQSAFWYDGSNWTLIRRMTNESLLRIQTTLDNQGYTSEKINLEIDKRRLYDQNNMSDQRILEINSCVKTEDDIKRDIEFKTVLDLVMNQIKEVEEIKEEPNNIIINASEFDFDDYD